jgi:hypothetical protein
MRVSPGLDIMTTPQEGQSPCQRACTPLPQCETVRDQGVTAASARRMRLWVRRGRPDDTADHASWSSEFSDSRRAPSEAGRMLDVHMGNVTLSARTTNASLGTIVPCAARPPRRVNFAISTVHACTSTSRPSPSSPRRQHTHTHTHSHTLTHSHTHTHTQKAHVKGTLTRTRTRTRTHFIPLLQSSRARGAKCDCAAFGTLSPAARSAPTERGQAAFENFPRSRCAARTPTTFSVTHLVTSS